eukprot:759688-Hanusia_phi.AAC.1
MILLSDWTRLGDSETVSASALSLPGPGTSPGSDGLSAGPAASLRVRAASGANPALGPSSPPAVQVRPPAVRRSQLRVEIGKVA